MSSTALQELSEGNRCWICLGEGDEVPPMGYPKDAFDWVKPCSCSLVAHRKCLTDWILTTDLDKRKRQLSDQENQPAPQQNISVTVLNTIGINIRSDSIDFNRGLLPPFFDTSDFTLCVKCPQCSNFLFLKNKQHRFVSFVQYLQKFATSGVRFMFYSTLISTSIASTIASVCATLSGTGIQIFNCLCPDSVQMKILNIPARSLVDASNRNILTGRFFTLTGLLPIFLFTLRKSPFKTSNLQEVFIQTFPLLFLSKARDLNEHPTARSGILLLNFSRYAYNILFSLTINRVYYRLVKSSQPSFIADRLSLEELNAIQQENQEEYKIQLEDELTYKNRDFTIWQKLSHYFSLKSKMRDIKSSRRRREIVNCMKFDYSSVFNKSSFFFTLLTTLLWPVAGERLSSLLLSKSSLLLRFTNKYAKTPDDSTFLRNLIGCCCVVLVKDLVNLFLAWRKMKQMNNLRIVEFGTDEWTRDSIVSLAEIAQATGSD